MEEKSHGVWDKEHETGKGHWEEAYASETFKTMVKLRYGFVNPAIVIFCILFFILFTIQQFYVDFASSMVSGNINVNFLYTMLLFPILWVGGVCFLRYVRKHVYPLENELVNTFSKK